MTLETLRQMSPEQLKVAYQDELAELELVVSQLGASVERMTITRASSPLLAQVLWAIQGHRLGLDELERQLRRVST